MQATYLRSMLLALAVSLGVALQSGADQCPAQTGRSGPEGDTRLQTQSSRAGAAAPSDYLVGPEDLLEVKIYGQDDLNREVRVNGEGEITLPLVGVVKVAGLSPKSIEQRLRAAYGDNYLKSPQITLTVKEYRHQRVSVTGAVEKPGYYDLIGPRRLLEVLAMAGGLAGKAGDAKAADVVHVIRGQGTSPTLVIDLRRLQEQGDSSLNIPIQNGDVVHVPFAGNAYVLGGVRNPGCVAVRDNLTLSQALALAGGADPVLATNQINIMRLDQNGNPLTITAHLDKVLSRREADVPLKDNDVVVVNIGPVKKSLYVFKHLMPGTSVSGTARLAP
uniref:Polysaccharide export protein n=1 Tax=Desulfobacca acetoxidans TaxID=60893 RepID=A0A7C3UWH1_9BACT